jgi:hypothetical protein
MAKQIVSGNLNQYGNNGQFETDRSTWGFADTTNIEVTRDAAFKTAGVYSAKARAKTTQQNKVPIIEALATLGPSSTTKKFIAKVNVRVPSSAQISVDASSFTLYNASNFFTIHEQTDKTVAQAKNVWVTIELCFTPSINGNAVITLWLDTSTNGLTQNGLLYADQFEVYEYIDVPDNPGPCTLEIDVNNTTITNETAPSAGDGIIQVAVTGAVGTIEYSKDGGQNWQLSNQFTGLTTGIYIVQVREQSTPTCLDEYPFVVNHGATGHDFTTAITNESVSGANDGAIAITVSGTGAPFQFTIDAGQTYQSGNNFSNLAPGVYYVAVKDTNGNIVLKIVTVEAGTILVDKIYHSENPITFSKAAAANWQSLVNYRLYNEVRVEDVADSGNYNATLKVELPPDNNNQAMFYLPEAFRGVFEFTPPSQNEGTIKRLTDRIKRFKNFHGELQNTEVTPPTLTESLPNLVLFGGIDKFNYPGLNYFGSYLPANKKFLTWAPTEKWVNRTQEDYLNFWVYDNFATLKLQIKAYFDDGTDQTAITKTKSGTKYTELYQIPAGPQNTGALLINAGKNVVRYELSLLDQNDVVISEVRTYHINQVTHPRSRYFMFLNSLGAFEVLLFTGIESVKTTFNRKVIQKFLAHNYSALDGEFQSINVIRQQQRSIGSGLIKNKLAKEWHEYLKDFIGSRLLFDITDSSRRPIVVSGGDHNSEDQNYELFIRFDVRDAYDNNIFTPRV